MMMVVVLIFTVCWLPYHIYFIITFYYPNINQETYIQRLFLAIYWLAMSNSMYNPIIYYYMNSRYVFEVYFMLSVYEVFILNWLLVCSIFIIQVEQNILARTEEKIEFRENSEIFFSFLLDKFSLEMGVWVLFNYLRK